MTEQPTGTCIGTTREGIRCKARATTLVLGTGERPLHVCGTHRIVHEETATEYGTPAATARVLTGARP